MFEIILVTLVVKYVVFTVTGILYARGMKSAMLGLALFAFLVSLDLIF